MVQRLVLPSATCGTSLRDPQKKRRMSKEAQPTMDGAPAPPPPPPKHKGGRPRLPQHLQTPALEAARERHTRRRAVNRTIDRDGVRDCRRRRRVTSPPLPFTPLTPKQKMDMLLDWHQSCPGSYAYDTPEEEHYVERDGPLDDPPTPQDPEIQMNCKCHYDE